MQPLTSVPRLLRVAEAELPTSFGDFRILGYEGRYPDHVEELVVLQMGSLDGPEPPLLRIHSQCLTGDVFHSLRCDCRAQLELSLEMVAAEGRGLIIYLQQEGRGIGLLNKIRAYQLQDGGADTVEANEQLGFEADLREYELPAILLNHLGVKRVRLLSNNPKKIEGLERAGIEITERVPCQADVNGRVEFYLRAKKNKMGHLLEGY